MEVKVKNVKRKFGSFTALENINFEVKESEIFGIVGMSGVGKSTLLRMLATLDFPTSGEILIEGKDTKALSSKELRLLRHKIGMIFQEHFLFSGKTVLENIALPLISQGISRNEANRKAKEFLEWVGLSGKEESYPLKLSGGERQRVAIARALIHAPSLLLCDEMTSALDPKTRKEILELLKNLKSKLKFTIILITHEMEVVRRICEKVIVLEKGRIIEEGSVESLFSAPKHPTTRELLQHIVHDIPSLEVEGDLWHLAFIGAAARKPLLTKVVRSFNVEVNILLGSIDRISKGEIGRLMIAVTGPPEERARAKAFLESEGVILEVVR